MMSLRSWVALLIFYVVYLLIGGFAFQAFECDYLPDTNESKDSSRTFFSFLMKQLKVKYHEEKNLTQHDDCDEWNLYNSVFFSFTALTTIGFGHLAPETWQGKLFCIFYSLLGVPINGILIGSLGSYFGSKLPKLRRKHSEGTSEIKNIILFGCQIFGYLIPGFIVFILVPAVIFWHIEEGWTYLDSLYFAFIALMTIGFGDYVAGRNEKVLEKLGGWKVVYETGLVIWILFGLGYIFMIISIITDGIKTPARKAVKKLAEAEKVMLTRILREIMIKRNKEASVVNSRRTSVMGQTISEDIVGETPDTFVLPPEKTWASYSTVYSVGDHQPGGRNPEIKVTESCNENEEVTSRHVIETEDATEETVDEMMDSINHDTITSLHNFIQSARLFQRSLSVLPSGGPSESSLAELHARRASNVELSPGSSRSDTVTRSTLSLSKLRNPFARRKTGDRSMDTSLFGSHPGIEVGMPGGTPGGPRTAWSQFGSRKTSRTSLTDVLRTTTLEEFLEAVEKVQAEDELLLTEDSEASSAHRKTSNGSHHNLDQNPKILTLNQEQEKNI